jgi:hypothetical protein
MTACEWSLVFSQIHMYSRLLFVFVNKKHLFLYRLDDLICAWDKVVGTDFETLVLLLLGELMH